jgi:hypothetical protein
MIEIVVAVYKSWASVEVTIEDLKVAQVPSVAVRQFEAILRVGRNARQHDASSRFL